MEMKEKKVLFVLYVERSVIVAIKHMIYDAFHTIRFDLKSTRSMWLLFMRSMCLRFLFGTFGAFENVISIPARNMHKMFAICILQCTIIFFKLKFVQNSI